MAVSKKRKKDVYVAPKRAVKQSENPAWLVPTLATLLIGGVLWIIVYYVSAGQYPIGSLASWNIGIGFASLMAGLFFLTRWK